MVEEWRVGGEGRDGRERGVRGKGIYYSLGMGQWTGNGGRD